MRRGLGLLSNAAPSWPQKLRTASHKASLLQPSPNPLGTMKLPLWPVASKGGGQQRNIPLAGQRVHTGTVGPGHKHELRLSQASKSGCFLGSSFHSTSSRSLLSPHTVESLAFWMSTPQMPKRRTPSFLTAHGHWPLKRTASTVDAAACLCRGAKRSGNESQRLMMYWPKPSGPALPGIHRTGQRPCSQGQEARAWMLCPRRVHQCY